MPRGYRVGKTRSDLALSIAVLPTSNLRELTSRQGQEYLGNGENGVKTLQVRSGASLGMLGLPLLDLGIDRAYSAGKLYSGGVTRSLYPTPGSVAIWPGCDELASSFWRSDLIVVRSTCRASPSLFSPQISLARRPSVKSRPALRTSTFNRLYSVAVSRTGSFAT